MSLSNDPVQLDRKVLAPSAMEAIPANLTFSIDQLLSRAPKQIKLKELELSQPDMGVPFKCPSITSNESDNNAGVHNRVIFDVLGKSEPVFLLQFL